MQVRWATRRWAATLVALAVLIVWVLNVGRPGARVEGCFDCGGKPDDQVDGSLWVNRRQLECKGNDQHRELDWVDAFILVDDLLPSDVIELRFPAGERMVEYTAMGTQYSIRFRGNTVVDISPRDPRPTSYQLYLRDGLNACRETPMKNVTRFVSDVIPRW